MSETDDKRKQILKDLLETQRIANIGSWRLDLATNRVVWSEELYRISERDPALPAPSPSEHMKFFTSESRRRLSRAHDTAVKQGGPYELELEAIKPDGSHGWIWIRAEAEKDESGKIVSILGVAQDITTQKAARKALQNSEERYRCLFDNSGVAISYFTPEGILVSFNRKALEITGGNLSAYVGKSIRGFVSEEEADKYLERIHITLSSDESQEYEDLIDFKTGAKWFVSTYAKVKNTAGQITGVQVSTLDITDRKKAQRALLESQITINAAFENSQAGIVIADAPDGKLRYINKAGLLIGNISEEVLTNNINGSNFRDIWSILHFDGTPFEPEEVPLIKALRCGEAFSEDFIIRRPGFEDRYVISNATPLRDASGKVTSSMVIMIDVTEKRQAEEIIRKQNELFSSLLKLLPVGVFMVNAAGGKPLLANEMGKTLLGRGILPDANETNLSQVYRAFKKDTNEQYPPSEMPILLGMKGVSAHIEDMVVEHPDGTRVLLEVFGSPVKDKEGHPWASLVTFMDITERKKAENELIYLSYHDSLTGFYNRRFFDNELARLDTAENLPLSVIICDINGLKLINDSFGHASGDKLLKKAAETIQAACRPDDIISRIGGDEFAVILPKTESEETVRIVKRIQESARKEKIENIELSIAIGYETKTSEKQNLIELLANAENHMYRHKLYEHSSTKNKTIEIIMNTLFEKSNRESMHSNRVSSICRSIAAIMNFDQDDVNKIRMAGLVHDIGKIGIDENILNKPGKLTSEEREQINKHPEIGWRILSSSAEFSELANFILNHHEKWDGSGYPTGLSGEKIPLEARIINVADSYDAMTSTRTYRAGLTREEAMIELKRCSGTQFDPEIVNIFIEKVLPYEDFS
jgi:diguanylate cyclase (GGDEF)-like protein/PAS domain S-box-containing protein